MIFLVFLPKNVHQHLSLSKLSLLFGFGAQQKSCYVGFVKMPLNFYYEF